MRKKESSNITYVSVMLFISFLLLFIGEALNLPIAFSFTVGSSMYPTVCSGDLAVLVSTSISNITKGDIAVYKTNTEFILHRVEDIENNTVIFKGDDNVLPDNPVNMSDVRYKVLFVIPYDIWVPLVSSIAIALGMVPQIYLYKKEKANSLYTYMLFFIFIILILDFSSALYLDRGYPVKPNPMPLVEKVTSTPDGKYYVELNISPENVSCIGGICSLSGNRIIVEPQSDYVLIELTLPTLYNVTADFFMHFGDAK